MKKHLPIFVLLGISLILIFFLYGEVILNPNQYLFSSTGDGIKNYFTYAYHIKHGASFVNLEGMNYPYGENFFYTDCQPALVLLLKSLSSIFPNISDYSIGILNELLITSIFVTFFIIYFLLIEFNIEKWAAVILCLGITLLAPQIYRLPGHFGLSFSCAIPLVWLLLLQCLKKQPSVFMYAGLFLMNSWWLFIHAYLGVICCAFSSLIIILNYLTDKKKTIPRSRYAYLLLATLAPIVLLKTLISITDSHSNRTDNPSGFFLYNAEPDDTFVPYNGPIREALDVLSNNIIKQEWEAKSYIGFASSLLFIYFLITLITNKLKNKSFQLPYSHLHTKQLNLALIASLLLYVFALGVPFKQVPQLLEVFSVLKQFRATGRFTWPFYYVTIIFCCVIAHDFYLKLRVKNQKTLGIIILSFYAGSIFFEGYYFHNQVAKAVNQTPNYFKKTLLTTDHQIALNTINPTHYQAIISLPFYHYGSESFCRDRQDEAVLNSLISSFHWGLPTTCASLVRASITESKKIIQLASPNYYDKAIQEDIPSEKPFLIIKSNTPLSTYESALLQKGKLLRTGKNFDLYTLSTHDLFHNTSEELYQELVDRQHSFYKKDAFRVSDSTKYFFYNGYENTASDTCFRGIGAYHGMKKGKNKLAYFEPQTFETGNTYHLSCWMFNGEKDALNLWFRLIVEEYDVATNAWHSTTIFPESAETIFGDWSLVEVDFTVRNSSNPIQIITAGKENSKAALHIDDLLIRESGLEIVKLDTINKRAFYNNHFIKP